jgi:hypothetical protein
MNWLFESPVAIVVIGILVLIALGALWSMSGRKELLYALAAAAALIVAALIVERLVTTDREAIRQTLLEIAADVESNNVRELVRHIHSGAPELKQRAEAEMPNYQFSECRITKIHMTDVDASQQPRSAIVEFNVMASGSFSQGGMSVSDTKVPRWVRLHMVQENDGRWTVQDYQHAPPQQFMSNQPMYGDPQ